MTMGTGRGEGGGEVASSMRCRRRCASIGRAEKETDIAASQGEGKGRGSCEKNLSDVPFLFSKRIREPIEFPSLPLRAEMSWKHLGDDN